METTPLLHVVVAMDASAPNDSLLSNLHNIRSFRLVGTAYSVKEVESLLRTESVDLLIVDINLPGGGAFSLIERMVAGRKPAVIFTASDDLRALEAFRYQPLDFILHPVESSRLDDALSRALDQMLARKLEQGDNSIQDLLYRAKAGVQSALRLMVKSAGRISFVKAEDIDWVEADRDYVRIHNAGKKHLLRGKISHFEQQLPQGRFLRIHRSTIVNIDRIKELQPLSFGEYCVVLLDGTRLTMSRSFRDRVFQKLQSAA
jgi:two-component system LytT family response regulator